MKLNKKVLVISSITVFLLLLLNLLQDENRIGMISKIGVLLIISIIISTVIAILYELIRKLLIN